MAQCLLMVVLAIVLWICSNPGLTHLLRKLSPSKMVREVSTPDKAGRHFSSSELLGYSIRDYFNLVDTRGVSQQSTLPRATLRALLKGYWEGLIFFFNEDGTLLGINKPGENLMSGSADTLGDFQKNERKQEWVRQILDMCPGARTVIFFPLWDPQPDRWSTGGLVWSNSPARILQADDVTYLAAFSRCIMTKKSRLDAITTDRAKANFISSVSHKLRTPLHGVLASAEALQETPTNFTQDNLICTITVCGEVLLDTTDQMYDPSSVTSVILLNFSVLIMQKPANPLILRCPKLVGNHSI